jgi:tetratricopeptide (TPR) repeat protein
VSGASGRPLEHVELGKGSFSVHLPTTSERSPPSRLDRCIRVLVLLLIGLLAVRKVGSPDAGFHLATGAAILAGGGWPRMDTFTYTVREHRYVDTSWGYDVLVAAVEARFGLPGLVLLHAGLVVAAFAIVLRTIGLARASPLGALLPFLLAGLLSEERFEVRPEVLSYVLLAAVLYLLQRHAERGNSPLWLLAPVFLIWANVHSLFVVGWGALALFNAGAVWRWRRIDRRLLAWSATGVLATFANPYGARGVGMSLLLSTRLLPGHVFHEQIGEYESPFRTLGSEQLGFYLLPLVCLFAFIAMTVAAAGPLWRQRRTHCLLLAAMFVPLALAMVRNAALLAIACLPGTAWGAPSAERWLHRLQPAWRRWLALGLRVALVLFTLGFGLRVVQDAYYVGCGRLERFGWGWNSLRLPVEAAAYAQRARLPDRMLNDFDFGGHFIWALRRPVFIDGRLEVMGEEFFATYEQIFASVPALETCVARYGIRWIVFPYRDRPGTLQMLSADPRWRLAYVDPLAAIFVRADTVPHDVDEAEVARLADPPPLDLATLPGLGAPLPRRGWRAWIDGCVRHQSYPVSEYSLGVFYYLRGDWERFARYSAAAIRQSRSIYPELYGNLGSALYALGRLPEARRCLEIAVPALPPYAVARRRALRATLQELDASISIRSRNKVLPIGATAR